MNSAIATKNTLQKMAQWLGLIAALALGYMIGAGHVFSPETADKPRAEHGQHAADHGEERDDDQHEHGARAASEHHEHEGEHEGDEHKGEEHEEGELPLNRQQLQAAGIGVARVTPAAVQSVQTYARVVAQAGSEQQLISPVEARVLRWLQPPGSAVHKGQALAQMHSAQAATLRAEQQVLAQEVQAAARVVEQNKALLAAGIIAKNEWQQSVQALSTVQLRQRSQSVNLLSLAGLDAQGNWQLLSPMDGVLTAQLVAAGGSVVAGASAAQLQNPALRQLQMTLPAQYSGELKTGLTVAPLSGDWQAQLSAVAPVDGQLQAWAQLTQGELPALGVAQEVRVALVTAGGLSVPESAVQQWQGQAVVFVVEENRVRAQPVMTGRALGGQIEVLSGVFVDQIIAADNAFLLKAELAKGEAGHEH